MLRASLDETSTDDRSGYPLALWRVANEGREEVSEGCKKTRRHRHKRRKESKATLRKQHRAKRLSARPKTDEKDAKKGNQLEGFSFITRSIDTYIQPTLPRFRSINIFFTLWGGRGAKSAIHRAEREKTITSHKATMVACVSMVRMEKGCNLAPLSRESVEEYRKAETSMKLID